MGVSVILEESRKWLILANFVFYPVELTYNDPTTERKIGELSPLTCTISMSTPQFNMFVVIDWQEIARVDITLDKLSFSYILFIRFLFVNPLVRIQQP
jgi:hypothetical protein